MSINDGMPAFPGTEANGLNNGCPGLSIRDYFAAKAMNGYLANSWQAQELNSMGESSREQMAIVAEISYVMADAMLKAREDEP